MKKQQQKQEQETEVTSTGKQDTIGERPQEIGGPRGPEPTRYGDWERRGRCIDF